MKEIKQLTTGFLKEMNDDVSFNINIPESTIQNLEKTNKILIIQTASKKFIKYMVYPVQNEKVIKLTFYGINISNKTFLNTFNLLKKFNIIHTSGASLKKNEIMEEIYLNPVEIDQTILEKELKDIEGIYKVLIKQIK